MRRLLKSVAGNPKEVLEDARDAVVWDYDAAYRLTDAKRTGTGAYNSTMTFDAVGNRKTLQADGAATTYTYDGANEMTLSGDDSGTTTYKRRTNNGVEQQ